MKTQEQLGAVHLKIEGLDKGRFKKLVEGHNTAEDMGIESLLDEGRDIIEHWVSPKNRCAWAAPQELIVSKSRLITLDELEQLLGVKKERTAEVIQAEIKELQRELDELRKENELKVGDVVLYNKCCIGTINSIYVDDVCSPIFYIDGKDIYFTSLSEIKKINPNKTVKEVLGLD